MPVIKDTLKKYSDNKTLWLHMPGHKGTLNEYDNTEIPQTDDFNNVSGPYAAAQNHLSETYLSSNSFYITTGATTGIKAMVLYAKVLSRRVVAMRNSHLSVINACCTYDVELTVIEPEFCKETSTYISPQEKLIQQIKTIDKKCIIIVTATDYYGRCVDIKAIKNAIGDKDILLFCDHAHGAHYNFSNKLPDSIEKYSDMWVHGAHKTLGALTQGAFLHCSKIIDINKITHILSTINTSSPSHLIAMTLEGSISGVQTGKWDKRAKECQILQDKINKLKHIKCADINWAKKTGYVDKDVCRIVLDAKEAGGGFYMYRILYEKHNIQLEMADFRYTTAIMTIYDEANCDKIFFNALEKLDEYKLMKEIQNINIEPKRDLSITDSYMKNAKYVNIEKSIGEVSAASIGAYPPGTVMIMPGEKIVKEHIDYIKQIIKSGGSTFGLINNMIAIVGL